MGREAREAVPELIDVLNKTYKVSGFERIDAVTALRAIGPDAAPALDTLRTIAADPNTRKQMQALTAAAISAIEKPKE